MRKYVLSESIDAFVLQPRANYYAYVQDVRKQSRLPKREFPTYQDAFNYCVQYLRIPADCIERPMY